MYLNMKPNGSRYPLGVGRGNASLPELALSQNKCPKTRHLSRTVAARRERCKAAVPEGVFPEWGSVGPQMRLVFCITALQRYKMHRIREWDSAAARPDTGNMYGGL